MSGIALDGPAVSDSDARQRIEACESTDMLAQVLVDLLGGAVDADTLWAMGTARYDQLDAARAGS